MKKKGLFWIPEIPDKKVAGFLNVDEYGKIEVDLVGCFESFINGITYHKYPIVNGILGSNPVVLCNAMESNRNIHFDSNDYIKIGCNILFIGINANKSRDLCFKKCTAHLPYFEVWLDNSDSFKSDIDFKKVSYDIKFTRPLDVVINIDDENEIGFGFNIKVPFTNFVQKQVSLEHSANILIKSTKRTTYRQMLDKLSHYNKLYMLFLQDACFPEEVFFYHKFKIEPTETEISVIRTRRKYEPYSKEIHAHDFLFTYPEIKKYYSKIVVKWFTYRDKYLTVLNPFYETLFDRGNVESNFINLMKSLESYHREFVGRKKQNQLMRYLELFERSRQCFNFKLQIKSKPAFCKKIKDLRNELTHSSPSIILKKRNYSHLFRINEKIRVILLANIFLDFGLDTRIIQNAIDRKFKYL